MFKKLLIASAILAVSSSVALAGSNYKGGQYKAPVASCPAYNPIMAPYIGLSLANRLTYGGTFRVFDGIPVNASLGYGGMIAPYWYLAAEIFGDYDIQVKNFSSFTGYKNTWSWGGSILPGYMINNMVLGYIRLGGIDTYFTGPAQWDWGGQAGIGLQTNLCQNLDLRAEYDYTYYGSKSTLGRPNALAASVGLTYRFA